MGVISLTVLAGFRNAFKTRLYEMPAHLYLLTWVPNLVLQTLFFTYLSLFAGGAPSRQWAILGSVMRLAALPTCIQTTYHLVADREEGNLSYLSTTPASLGLLWLGRSLYFSVEAVVTVLLISLLVFPFAGMGGCLETWFLYVVPVAASCFSLSGLGLLVGSLVFRTTYDMAVTSLVTQALLIMSGVLIPTESLPLALNRASRFVPLANGLRAAHALAGAGKVVWPLILAEVAVGTAYWCAGIAVLKSSIRAGRRKGSLEAF